MKQTLWGWGGNEQNFINLYNAGFITLEELVGCYTGKVGLTFIDNDNSIARPFYGKVDESAVIEGEAYYKDESQILAIVKAED